MPLYNKKSEMINNETTRFSTFNRSNESENVFQIIYHSIKDLVEAGEQDVFTISGKIRFFLLDGV
jgi:uncharacterized protein YabN with tetrapyrrole methylase and pyrophosphatase domain